MATNEVFDEGDVLSLPVPAGTKSGDPVKVGSLIGVAQTDRADSANGVFGGGNADGNASVDTDGVHRLNVTEAVANIGDPVYFVTGQTGLVSASAGNTLFGYALALKGAGAGVIPVKLTQV